MNEGLNIASRFPVLRSRWWTVALALSVMLNLLVIGALLGRNLSVRQTDGVLKDNITQLVPGKFISQLPEQRRREIIKLMRDYRGDLKTLREASQGDALNLADALDNYDAAKVKLIVDSFTTGNTNLVTRRGAVINDLLAKLTPDERKLMAQVIRDRDAQRKKQAP